MSPPPHPHPPKLTDVSGSEKPTLIVYISSDFNNRITDRCQNIHFQTTWVMGQWEGFCEGGNHLSFLNPQISIQCFFCKNSSFPKITSLVQNFCPGESLVWFICTGCSKFVDSLYIGYSDLLSRYDDWYWASLITDQNSTLLSFWPLKSVVFKICNKHGKALNSSVPDDGGRI